MNIKIEGEIIDFPDDIYNTNKSISYYLLKLLLKKCGSNLKKVVNILNDKNPEHKSSPQNLSNKLSNDTLRVKEFLQIIDNLGYSISFYINVDVKEQETDSKNCNFDDSVSDLILKGYSSCNSVNFKQIVIVGENAIIASIELDKKIKNNMSILDETMAMIDVNNTFNVKCIPMK